ncbi:MAG: hypothetical protein ACM3NH_03690 [Candidatus Saccharibacteria bacterium]
MCMNITAPARLTRPFGIREFPMDRKEILLEEPGLAGAVNSLTDEELNALQFRNPSDLSPEYRAIVTAAMLAHQRHRLFSPEALLRREHEKD